jgi:hypothetical protein
MLGAIKMHSPFRIEVKSIEEPLLVRLPMDTVCLLRSTVHFYSGTLLYMGEVESLVVQLTLEVFHLQVKSRLAGKNES